MRVSSITYIIVPIGIGHVNNVIKSKVKCNKWLSASKVINEIFYVIILHNRQLFLVKSTNTYTVLYFYVCSK